MRSARSASIGHVQGSAHEEAVSPPSFASMAAPLNAIVKKIRGRSEAGVPGLLSSVSVRLGDRRGSP